MAMRIGYAKVTVCGVMDVPSCPVDSGEDWHADDCKLCGGCTRAVACAVCEKWSPGTAGALDVTDVRRKRVYTVCQTAECLAGILSWMGVAP